MNTYTITRERYNNTKHTFYTTFKKTVKGYRRALKIAKFQTQAGGFVLLRNETTGKARLINR